MKTCCRFALRICLSLKKVIVESLFPLLLYLSLVTPDITPNKLHSHSFTACVSRQRKGCRCCWAARYTGVAWANELAICELISKKKKACCILFSKVYSCIYRNPKHSQVLETKMTALNIRPEWQNLIYWKVCNMTQKNTSTNIYFFLIFI